MRVIGYRHQRTLASTAVVAGRGLIAGAPVVARFVPAPVDSGVSFRRTDLPGAPTIPARADRVTGTQRRTTLGPSHTGVSLVEHVLAALAGLRIDNCVVELDAGEPPGLDGSAAGFVAALSAAGTVHQPARRPILTPTKTALVRAAGATLALHPVAPGDTTLRATYRLDYGPGAPIPPQTFTAELCPDTFARDVAACRTFLTESECAALKAQGVGRHLEPADILVFGPRGPIDNRVRFADEPARHKVLDLIGDLALCGFDLAGHAVAYRSGHALNVELAHALVAAVAGAPRRPAARVTRRPAKQAA